MKWKLNSEEVIRNLLETAGQYRLVGKVLEVEAVEQVRSLDQNAISFAWYKEIAMQKGDITALEARCYSKLHCGVPYLMSESETFRERWERLIKDRFAYEEKLELMEEFPVTSLMKKKQKSVYLERVQKYWGKQGVTLLFPNEPPIG